MNYPCSKNTDLYRNLILKSKLNLQKLSLSLFNDGLDPLILLRELKDSRTIKFLKLYTDRFSEETLEIIGSMTNL